MPSLPAWADPLVDVTIRGDYHNADDTFTASFSFDPAVYTTAYDTEYYFPIVQPTGGLDFPSPNTLDIADFGNGVGDNDTLTLLSTVDGGFYGITFYPGSCQSLPPDVHSGVAPVFTTMTCLGIQSFEDGLGGAPTENAGVSEVDFVVEPGATTPEPSSFVLLGSGALAALDACRRRRRR